MILEQLLNFKFRLQCFLNLRELINFYYPRNHQKTHGFLMILVEIEVN